MPAVVLGAVFVDIKGYPAAQYIPGGRNVGRIVNVHGGVARNIAEDIANLELRPIFVSLVDDTPAGEDVLRKLQRHKVDTRYIKTVPDGMGTWLAIFDNTGDVVASISKRPDLTSLAETLDEKGDEIFSRADCVLLEIDLEQNVLHRVFDLAHRHHIPVYAAVSNMSIAVKRRDLLRKTDCLICNSQEAGIFFSEDLEAYAPGEMPGILLDRVRSAQLRAMVVTMGKDGAAYADIDGHSGLCPALTVDVIDTTGAGDAFFAGTSVGLSAGKTLAEACSIGTRLAASVICTKDNVCPRFLPQEFGLPPVEP